MQIDKHSVGYVSYHGGIRSLFSTQLIRDTGKTVMCVRKFNIKCVHFLEKNRVNISLQVGLPHSYVLLQYTRKMLNQELKIRIAVK